MIRIMDSSMQNREKAIILKNIIIYFNLNMSSANKGGQPVDVDITKVTP